MCGLGRSEFRELSISRQREGAHGEQHERSNSGGAGLRGDSVRLHAHGCSRTRGGDVSDLTWMYNSEVANAPHVGLHELRDSGGDVICRYLIVHDAPAATLDYSAEQLRAMGMVGVYWTPAEAQR